MLLTLLYPVVEDGGDVDDVFDDVTVGYGTFTDGSDTCRSLPCCYEGGSGTFNLPKNLSH